MPTTSRSRRLLLTVPTALGALALVGATFVGTASASPKDAMTTSGHTEDDDTNDGGTPNNVVDDGDDRHPSGKDRSVEPGGSTNQGRATSDPDDDGRGPDRSNGGPDQPDGSGGTDLADQDGNNGCGNDDDFEDDNEGWCGSKPGNEKPAGAAGGPGKAKADEAESTGKSRTAGAARPSGERHAPAARPTGGPVEDGHAAVSEPVVCRGAMTDADGSALADCAASVVLDTTPPATCSAGSLGGLLSHPCTRTFGASASAADAVVVVPTAVKAPADLPGTVSARSAGATLFQAATGGMVGVLATDTGALAATGLDLITLLAAAVLALAAGGGLLWTDRRSAA